MSERHGWRSERPHSSESSPQRKGKRVVIKNLFRFCLLLDFHAQMLFLVWRSCSAVAAEPVQGHSDEDRGASWPWTSGGSDPEDLCCCLQPGAGQTFIQSQPNSFLKVYRMFWKVKKMTLCLGYTGFLEKTMFLELRKCRRWPFCLPVQGGR